MPPLPPPLTESFRLRAPDDLRVRYFWSPKQFANVTPFLLSMEWNESQDQVAREFTLTLDDWDGLLARLVAGGVVLIEYGPTRRARWEEWFRGTVVSDAGVNDTSEKTKTLRVQDPMRILGRSEGQFAFKPNRTASQSIEAILKRSRLPIGNIEHTSKKLPGLTFKGSFYDAIGSLLVKTRQAGGGRFVPEFHAGRFYLVRYVKPAWSWDLDTVLSRIASETNIEEVVTKMVVTGDTTVVVQPPKKTKKGRKSHAKPKKVRRPVSAVVTANAQKLQAFGLIETLDDVSGGKSTTTKLKNSAAASLNAKSTPKRTLDVEIPFESFSLRRQQMVHFDERDPVTGAFGRYYVASLTGRFDGQSASMSLSLTRDPAWPVVDTSALEFGRGQLLGGGGGTFQGGAGSYPGDNASKQAIAGWMARAAQEAGLPPILPVMASLGESGLTNHKKPNKAGALGLFQIIPKFHPDVDPVDPEASLAWFVKVAGDPKKYGVRHMTLQQVMAQGEAGYGEWIARDIERSDQGGAFYQKFAGQAKQLLGSV